MKKDTIAIIQARMGSNRLPRKMTKKLGKYRIIEWVIKRLKKSKKIDYIVLATTKKKNDNILITFAKKYNIEYFRGSEINVFDRFYQISKNYNCNSIIRVSADNPFIDPELIDDLINKFKNKSLDYGNNLYNFHKSNYADGFGAEIFSFSVLKKIKNKLNAYHKEHVTSYIRENDSNFKILKLKAPKYLNEPSLKFDIDTFSDLKKFQNLINISKINIYSSSRSIIKEFKKI